MPNSRQKIVRIAQNSANPGLSRAQKQFNNLVKKIAAQKKLLIEWQNTIPVYNLKVDREYKPLLTEFNDHRSELVHLFDRSYQNPLFKKTDKAKLKHLIGEVSQEVIYQSGRDDLKPVYDRYHDVDFDTVDQEANSAVGAMMKEVMQNMFDIELGDDADFSSPEQLHAAIDEKLREKQSREETRENIKPRKKSRKQLEQEAKKAEEAQKVSKSIQEVYRKLVGALHPDRELDPAEKTRKTELMQRVNTAYGKKDLLQLLELQLELENIDQTQINNIAEDRLKHFNKILKDQLDELSEEIASVEMPFRMQLGISPYVMLTPKQLLLSLSQDTQVLTQNITSLRNDLKEFENPAALKAWLKNFKIPKKSRYDEFDELFDMMPFDFK